MHLLQERGLEVHAYARFDGSERVLEARRVVCHDIPFQRSPFRKENMQSLRLLTDSFRQEKFHMVHVHTPAASILGRIAAKRASVPFVLYTAHGFHFYKGARWRNWVLYYPLEWVMARYTDILITINGEDYHRARHFPVRERVTYVPGVGLDVGYYQSCNVSRGDVRKQLGIGKGMFVISCIAELIPRKNVVQLIEAVNLMAERGASVGCLLVGEGEMEEELKHKVKRMGIESHIYFLGTRRDIPQILRASDVCVLVSKQEGLPRALMEAMAAGKPIVASDIRGNRDLIVDGENGILVPVGDAAGTANGLNKLYKEPELRRSMGKKNKEKVMQYDISEILKHVEDIYFSGIAEKTSVSASPKLPETV